MLLQRSWRSGQLWLKVLSLLFLLLQYPVSALVLLWWNSKQETQAEGTQAKGWVSRLAALWAWICLSLTLPLVDMTAEIILLSSSLDAATLASSADPDKARLAEHAWWWRARPLHLLRNLVQHRLLPGLQALCLHSRVPAGHTILKPKEGAVEVWAENHLFARMPMEALLEALPQLVLQTMAFFLATDPNTSSPVLLLFMLSVTLSTVSMGKALAYIKKAGAPVGLTFWQSSKLLLQLQGTFRVPAGVLSGHPSTESDNRLAIKMPLEAVNLTPLQEVGFIQAKLADYSRYRILRLMASSVFGNWTLQIDGLRPNQLNIRRGEGRAVLLMEEVISDADKAQQLDKLTRLELTNCSRIAR